MIIRLIAFAFLSIASTMHMVYGQEPKPQQRGDTAIKAKRGDKDAADGDSKKRIAADHLEMLGSQAKRLNNSILKVQIAAKIADALWDYDDSNARQLFMFAFQTIDGVDLTPDKDQRAATAEKQGGSFGPLFHLRAWVVQLAARHDYKFAETLRQSLEKKSGAKETSKTNSKLTEEELKKMSLDVAAAMAATQPSQSAQIIRAFITQGIDDLLVYTLIKIRSESPALADKLYGEAIALAASHGLNADELASLSNYVLPSEEELFLGVAPSNDATRVTVIRQFLDYAYLGLAQFVSTNRLGNSESEIDHEAAERAYYVLKASLDLFDRFQPGRSASVANQMRSLLGLMSPQDANKAEETAGPTLEDLIQRAESAVGERRRTIAFMRASSRALANGNVEKAVELAERIDDPYERKIQTSLIRYQAAMKELRSGRIDPACHYAEGIEFIPQRVAVFHRVAQKLWASKEPDRARAKLEEIWEWTGKTDNNPQKVDAMLKLTNTMAQHDVERGFQFLQTAIRVVNATDFSYKPPDGRKISVEVHIAPDMLDFDSVFGLLARSDMERAHSAAQLLTSQEFALLADTIVWRQLSTAR
jgi:hypothetical protein